MTFTEFMEKMEQVHELLQIHNVSLDECQVKMYVEGGVPSRIIVTQNTDECLTTVNVTLN